MRIATAILLTLALCAPAFALDMKVPKEAKLDKAANLPLAVPGMSFKGLPGAVGDLYVPEMSFKGLDGAVGDLYVPDMSFKGKDGAVGDLYVPSMSFKGLDGAVGDLYVPAMSFKGKSAPPMRAVTPARGLGALKPALRAPAKPVTRALPATRAPQPTTREVPATRRTSPSRLPPAPEEPVENYKP